MEYGCAKTTIKTYKKATKLPIKNAGKFIKAKKYLKMTHTNHNFDCFNRSIPAIYSGDTYCSKKKKKITYLRNLAAVTTIFASLLRLFHLLIHSIFLSLYRRACLCDRTWKFMQDFKDFFSVTSVIYVASMSVNYWCQIHT